MNSGFCGVYKLENGCTAKVEATETPKGSPVVYRGVASDRTVCVWDEHGRAVSPRDHNYDLVEWVRPRE